MRNVGVELRLQSRMIACLWFPIKKNEHQRKLSFLVTDLHDRYDRKADCHTTPPYMCMLNVFIHVRGDRANQCNDKLVCHCRIAQIVIMTLFCHTNIPFWHKDFEKEYIWPAADRQCGTTDKTMCGTWHSDRGTSSGQANCFQAQLDYLNRLCFPCPGIRKQLLGYPPSAAYVFHPSGNYGTYSQTKHSNQYWNHFRRQLTKQETCSSYLPDKLFDNENLDWN